VFPRPWLLKALIVSPATSTAIPGIPFCVPIGFPPNYWTVWISILGFEVLLLGLALYRAFTGGLPEALDSPSSEHRSPWRTRAQRPWKNTKRVARVFRRTERIIDILIRDSILYFVVYVPRLSVDLPTLTLTQDVRGLPSQPFGVVHWNGV
jgi:hypothetical protein